MSEPPDPSRAGQRARSFDGVVDAYDRARPTYPREAAQWLVGQERVRVLELGAGTGKLTEQLVALGHDVIATDPSEPMLRRLTQRVPAARAVQADAEHLAQARRSVNAVVVAQAFHWFDAERVLLEVARVLRPGGSIGLVWNYRDERVPWVRRLGAIIGEDTVADSEAEPVQTLDDSGFFETVTQATFRFWQPLTRESLRDLVVSRSNIAVLPSSDREPVLRKVDELYDEYGRGHDGMLLPYVTHAFRAVVLPWAAPQQAEPQEEGPQDEPQATGGHDSDSLLIDFR